MRPRWRWSGGPRPQTVLIPPLVTQAQAGNTVRVVGRGLNRWSTVHLDDMADLYHLALTDPAATGFYFVEGGEDASFADIGEAIARRLGLGAVEPWDLGSAAAAWGEGLLPVRPRRRQPRTCHPGSRPWLAPLASVDHEVDRAGNAPAVRRSARRWCGGAVKGGAGGSPPRRKIPSGCGHAALA
ncbi:NAD-dependent epimerase/dehydratase family protein [Streptomyces fungicidicus]|uniref:NAD-dependent epimerase/dehydratase family protein n=1 Tax=Streptomyces fungicidicus TaxID=68203 RepID=UPI003698E0CC